MKTDTAGWNAKRTLIVLVLTLLLGAAPRIGFGAEKDKQSHTEDGKATTASRTESSADSKSAEDTAGQAASTTKAPVEDSPLVRAAKAARSGKKVPAKVKLTDADAKNSQGTLIELSEKPLPEATPEEKAAQAVAAERAANRKAEESREAAANAEEIEKTRAQIDDLTKRLRGLEESYYDEQDPATRERLERQFVSMKKEIADAKARLEELQRSQ